MKFRAAVLHKQKAPLVIEEIQIVDPQPGDVLIRLHASGLCHTDLEVIQGSLPYPLPIVLGHEGAGVVEAVGDGVSLVSPGDHVICSWNPNCGHCFYCEREQPILCEVFTDTYPKGHLMDNTSRMTVNNSKLHHFSETSTHAQYTIVPESGAIPVSKNIPFDRACLIGCGVMTGFGAVTNVAKVPMGASVAVFGTGAVGLNAVQAARLACAEPIIAVDIATEKLKAACQFGATETVNAAKTDPVQKIRELTKGRGADYVIESAGIVHTFSPAIESVRRGGMVVLLGKTEPAKNISIRWGALMGERFIVRSSYGAALPRRDFPLLTHAYLEGKLLLDELVTQHIKLDQINKGFASMERGEGIRTVINLQS